MLFFNVTATPKIYTYCNTLSLHDALPIYRPVKLAVRIARQFGAPDDPLRLHEGGQFPAQRMDQAVFGIRFRQPRSRAGDQMDRLPQPLDRKSTRLNSSH